MILLALLAVAGVVLLILAGFNVGGPRFNPGWLGLGLLAGAYSWGLIAHLGNLSG